MNIAIIGYGRMGREIEQILLSRGHKIELIIDVTNAGMLNKHNLESVDVAIEFSTPETAYDNVIKCIEYGTPVVCGTTAWLDKLNRVKELCVERDGTFFYASNYSVGVNLMFKVNEMLSRLMNRFEEYDVTVLEEHHTGKKDVPSGTAITIAEGILEGVDRKTDWVLGASTVATELNISALRRSVVPGTHTVVWDSEVDEITLIHRAKSRRGFAMGAVLAAEFIAGRKGVYSMDDLLK